MPRRWTTPSLRPWLTAALLLHGLVYLVWRSLPASERRAEELASHPPAPLELELLYQDPAPAEAPLSRYPLPETHEPIASTAASGERRAASRALGRRSTRPTEALPPTELGLEGRDPERSDDAARVTDDGLAESDLGGKSSEVPRETVPRHDGVPPAASPERLAELGYGVNHPDAVRPYLDVSPLTAAQERLDQHLTQALLDQDRDRSVGIEGPVTNALHLAAMSVVAPRSHSKIAIIIGRDGKLADFRIVETNRDARFLEALKERVRRLMADQVVRVPNGRPVEFIYELKSEVLLPSGRAPGFGVEVLGQPLKKSPEEKSSKLSILKPVLEFKPQVEADPDRNGKVTQTLPQLAIGLSLLELDADPVDIAANARQVVRTRLIRQRVL